jgi:hypothetical protein
MFGMRRREFIGLLGGARRWRGGRDRMNAPQLSALTTARKRG